MDLRTEHPLADQDRGRLGAWPPVERPSWADPTEPCGLCAQRFVGVPVVDTNGNPIGKVVSAEFMADGDVVTITTDQALGLVSWDDEPAHPWWSWGNWMS